MEAMKMRLYSGEVLEIAEFGFPPRVVLVYANKEEALTIWNVLTDEALVEVEILQGDDVVAAYRNCRVNGVQYVMPDDGEVTVHVYLEGDRYDPNAEYAEAGRILLGEEEF